MNSASFDEPESPIWRGGRVGADEPGPRQIAFRLCPLRVGGLWSIVVLFHASVPFDFHPHADILFHHRPDVALRDVGNFEQLGGFCDPSGDC